jgi:adenylosuccinate lyase
MLDVEAALAWARAEVGDIPQQAAEDIEKHASTKFVKIERVKEIEKTVEHETMALVEALSEVSEKGGAYVHLGATSADILDTATALQIKEGIVIIGRKLDELEAELLTLSKNYRDTMIVGRTHGQLAIPMTLGLKFSVWLREVSRHVCRLAECRQRVLVGKMSGAVGTMAGFGKNAYRIQELVMNRLGLGYAEATTQIIQRDRYAELICDFAMIASSLDKFATEIRNLQRPEIDELAEPFQVGKQVGSSAMPHKRNPWRSENVSSLAKLMRSLVGPSLESIVTWHERDLTQSAVERFTIPEAFILLDHMLNSMIRIFGGIQINTKHMLENLMKYKDPMMAESVLVALVQKGAHRQEAHRIVQKIALESMESKRDLAEALADDPAVAKLLTRTDIDSAMDPKLYLGMSGKLVDLAVEKTVRERRARGLGS